MLIAAILSGLLATGPAPQDIVRQPAVRVCLWALMQATRYGFEEHEAAAFLVAGEGHVGLVPWPRSEGPHQAAWKGPFPPGTIAIVHTHPNWIPNPSAIDARTAQRRGIPIYVVTRLLITKTTGSETLRVVEGDWKPSEFLR